MILNFQCKTSGYTIQATVTGSYGETTTSRVGRAYKNVVDAYLAWQRMLPKYPDALIIDPQGRACWPDAEWPILKSL